MSHRLPMVFGSLKRLGRFANETVTSKESTHRNCSLISSLCGYDNVPSAFSPRTLLTPGNAQASRDAACLSMWPRVSCSQGSGTKHRSAGMTQRDTAFISSYMAHSVLCDRYEKH